MSHVIDFTNKALVNDIIDRNIQKKKLKAHILDIILFKYVTDTDETLGATDVNKMH